MATEGIVFAKCLVFDCFQEVLKQYGLPLQFDPFDSMDEEPLTDPLLFNAPFDLSRDA